MTATATSELRIPADPAYIVVAKRAAAGFGCVAGFGVEALDELAIAVAQACGNAIDCCERAGGAPGLGQIRVTFTLEDQRLEVHVRSSVRAEQAATRSAPVGQRRMETVARLRPAPTAGAIDLALRMMGLFVDDCHYRVDARTGGLRVRLTKYRVS